MKKYFITGLLIWIPLAITFMVLAWIVGTLDAILLWLPTEHQPSRYIGFDIPGVKWEVTKEMSADAPRRIVRITTQIWLPFAKAKDPAGLLEKAALNCPVHHSLHPAIERPVTFHWAE